MIRWQFDMTWSLLEVYLDELTDADCCWQPSMQAWTVRQTDDGSWIADWADPEPVPTPAVTIGWLTWHICWWWEAAMSGWRDGHLLAPTDARWPGSATAAVGALRALRGRWIDVLGDPVLQQGMTSTAAFPWSDNPGRTNEHVLLWVNTELMKNTAEIGQLKRIRATTAQSAKVSDAVELPPDIDPAIRFSCPQVPSTFDYLFDAHSHTWPGRMAAYCPAQDLDYRISLEELPDDLPVSTRYWVEGFLAGNHPVQPDASV